MNDGELGRNGCKQYPWSGHDFAPLRLAYLARELARGTRVCLDANFLSSLRWTKRLLLQSLAIEDVDHWVWRASFEWLVCLVSQTSVNSSWTQAKDYGCGRTPVLSSGAHRAMKKRVRIIPVPKKKKISCTDLLTLDVYVIENKSVSRKHLVIHVGPVNPGDSVCNTLRTMFFSYAESFFRLEQVLGQRSHLRTYPKSVPGWMGRSLPKTL